MTSGAIITPSEHDRVRSFEVEIPRTRLGDQLAEHLTPGLQRFRVSGARCGQRQRAGFSSAWQWIQMVLKLSGNIFCCNPAHQDRGTQHGAFEGSFTIDSADAREFTYSV